MFRKNKNFGSGCEFIIVGLGNPGREYENTFLDYVFNDSVMSFTFPNLRYMDSEGREIFVKDIIGIEK